MREQDQQQAVQRIPPQAIEVEESVLGSMLIEQESADMVLARLRPEDFYKPAHRLIYQALIDLDAEGSPMDMISLEQKLKDQQQLEKAGGSGYLADLTRSVSSASNVEYHCQIIREKTIKRNLILQCGEVIKAAYDPSSDTYDVVDQAQEAVFGVAQAETGTMRVLSETVKRVAEDVIRIQEVGEPIGIRTGLDIDKTLQGFQDAKMYVLGARPSMGKTALVMTIMRRLALDGRKSGILSLETSDKSLGIRLIAQTSDLQADKITSGSMNKKELDAFLTACGELSEWGIYIDDEPALSAQKVRAKCRLMAKKGVDIIFIDFLQLINADGRTKHEEIGTITKVVKQVAKEIDIPVVVLSQLSRKVEDRNDKRPQMADLRESGSIEEDADCIMFLYRPEYYGITTTPEGQSTEGMADLIIAKNKDGKTGLQRLRFIPEYMRFENFAYAHNQIESGPVTPPHVPFSDMDDERPF